MHGLGQAQAAQGCGQDAHEPGCRLIPAGMPCLTVGQPARLALHGGALQRDEGGRHRRVRQGIHGAGINLALCQHHDMVMFDCQSNILNPKPNNNIRLYENPKYHN